MATGLHSVTSMVVRAAAAALLWSLALGASAQTVRYIHTDALGSVAVVTDQNRNVIERREYEPYGFQLTPAIKDGPGYTGHVQDAATGLTYMQQRYYDPQIGRFLSVDPVTAESVAGKNFNRYWYANDNPYKFTDPDGRMINDWSNTFTGGGVDGGRWMGNGIGNACGITQVCYGAGDSGTPRTEGQAKNGGNSEGGDSIGGALLGDAIDKLSDGEAWREGLKTNAEDMKDFTLGGVSLFSHAAQCAGKCALSEFVGDSLLEATAKGYEKTTEMAMERAFKETEWTKASRLLERYQTAKGGWSLGSVMWCTAACPGHKHETNE